MKVLLITALLMIGVTGFFIRYAKFFQKGATSVVARTDYWRAAATIFSERPMFGSGPGTFSILYQKIRAPGAEMAKLCHNDYLEQASDSGLIGFLAFFCLVLLTLINLYRYRNSIFDFSLWLGLLVLSLHSLMEFHFYIPALAWPFFLFLGMQSGRENQWTSRNPAINLAKK